MLNLSLFFELSYFHKNLVKNVTGLMSFFLFLFSVAVSSFFPFSVLPPVIFFQYFGGNFVNFFSFHSVSNFYFISRDWMDPGLVGLALSNALTVTNSLSYLVTTFKILCQWLDLQKLYWAENHYIVLK